MNPLMLFRSLPYLIIALLGAALIWTTGLYFSERDKRVALAAGVQALGEAAQASVVRILKASEANLKTVKEQHEQLEPTIRADAVRNYLSAHPQRVRDNSSCSRAVPGPASGLKVDDGTLEEPLLDIALIEEAASDANKLAAWQEWCQLNHCPIKE